MKDCALRYPGPIDVARPRGSRQLEGFSLKLNRLVRTFDHPSYDFSIGLEADPGVVAFRERPVRFERAKKSVSSFWVCRSDSETIVWLDKGSDVDPALATIDCLPVVMVTLADIAASGVWISNWRRMLPILIAGRESLTGDLHRSICAFVTQKIALARIEREFGKGDPGTVRASVFDLIRISKLTAPSLRTEQLSTYTLVEPTP